MSQLSPYGMQIFLVWSFWLLSDDLFVWLVRLVTDAVNDYILTAPQTILMVPQGIQMEATQTFLQVTAGLIVCQTPFSQSCISNTKILFIFLNFNIQWPEVEIFWLIISPNYQHFLAVSFCSLTLGGIENINWQYSPLFNVEADKESLLCQSVAGKYWLYSDGVYFYISLYK